VQWHSEGNSSLEDRLGVKGAVSVDVDHHDLLASVGVVAKSRESIITMFGGGGPPIQFVPPQFCGIRQLLPPPTMSGRPACQV
jgi:hypothetical protein